MYPGNSGAILVARVPIANRRQVGFKAELLQLLTVRLQAHCAQYAMALT